jgi:hypothetical protein
MRTTRWLWGALIAAAVVAPLAVSVAQGAIGRALTLDIVFDDSCDGMDLRLPDRGSVTGRHTGCTANEFVTGSKFSLDGETGVSVSYRDVTIGRRVRFDIYQTGFRAGRFYVYDTQTGVILRFSTFSPAPIED